MRVEKKNDLYSILLFIPVTVLFYWKTILTSQFTQLASAEAVNQAWSWWQFWIASVRSGSLPIWDPYTLGGHSFPGEMQTAAFYPVHLLLALIPSGPNYAVSPLVYHSWDAFAHILAACFMFALVRELGLGRFPAFLAGICFSLGGFVSRMQWPHMLESAMWLPLIFLFMLRGFRATGSRSALLNAGAGGLMFGMAVRAGGLHIIMLQAIAVAAAGVFYAIGFDEGKPLPLRGMHRWGRAVVVVATIGIVGGAIGAIQLAASLEFSPLALRFLGGSDGALPGDQKIPYAHMNKGFYPNGFFTLLVPNAFDGNIGNGVEASPYMGVFPLLLAVIGIWKCWSKPWVRFLAGLALVAFLYSFGALSPLHGVLYAIVPGLWAAREAARIVYLADFSLTILAAYGADLLFSSAAGAVAWTALNRVLAGIVITCIAFFSVPAVFGRPGISPWVMLSLVMILLSCFLFRYISHGNIGLFARLLAVSFVLFDLSAWDWSAVSKLEHPIFLDRLLSCRNAVRFLKTQRGPFRVEVGGYPRPNIGDVFGIQTTNTGGGVTIPINYLRLMGQRDLLNVRYRLEPASTQEPGALYTDANWKIYANPKACPRAWLVHETALESSLGSTMNLLETPGFDPRRVAVVETRVPVTAPVQPADETVVVAVLEANRMELKVRALTPGLLVVSETYYPGWVATIDRKRAEILRVDGALRGIVVPAGATQVVLRYTPRSIYFGGALTLATLIIVGCGLWFYRRELVVPRSREEQEHSGPSAGAAHP